MAGSAGSGRRRTELEVAICWANDTTPTGGAEAAEPGASGTGTRGARLEPCAGGAISVAIQPVADSVSDHAPT